MRVSSCGITDVGVKRTKNEDNFLVNEDLQLFVVCDGMGGHAGGEYASAIAVHTVEEAMLFDAEAPGAEGHNGASPALETAREKLRHAVRLAGRRIFHRAQEEPEYGGMGTTCLALVFDGAHALWAHVGDSRAYLLRGGAIEQLTEDHSWVNEKLKEGLITAEQARNHKLKNIITRSLGYTEEVDIDLDARPVQSDDRFVLCSDGLSNLVDSDEIGRVANAMGPMEAARRLVQMACERGGDDNITVIVVHVDELA